MRNGRAFNPISLIFALFVEELKRFVFIKFGGCSFSAFWDMYTKPIRGHFLKIFNSHTHTPCYCDSLNQFLVLYLNWEISYKRKRERRGRLCRKKIQLNCNSSNIHIHYYAIILNLFDYYFIVRLLVLFNFLPFMMSILSNANQKN